MDKTKAIELIFVQWKASLKDKDRRAQSLRTNFEELFQEWRGIDCSFDELFDSYLPKAIKAHQPDSYIIRKKFQQLKQHIPRFDKTEKEFTETWLKTIEDTATSTFFEFFSPNIIEKKSEPAAYGNMSAKEYKAMRKYADQFPILDTSELEKRWQQEQYNLDIDDMIKNVLGDKNVD